ncbi:MAG: Nif3-like dinuclear metal center hexameric protein [Magnetococcales bacterium]|nr:Nif3-like dinuclear metal center hexameric protein [Magnetococcales bacterium]MBF0321444.1 Nif3-like dinuclear metal center hexameric protein [Magnetococcales bacterium]
MTRLTEIEQFLAQTMRVDSIADHHPNGVQVRGRESVEKIVSGVSACQAIFDAAVAAEADLVLVHHGMFWDQDPRVVEGSLKERLKTLLQHDLTLMAYHLPLDCHPVLGNNAQILSRLGLEAGEPFGHYHGTALSHVGRCVSPLSIHEFSRQVRDLFGGEPLVLPFGPESVRHVAVCSGAAPALIREARALGADLFLTGEGTEYIYHFAREEKLHFMAAGHHRTEKFGVQAVGELLAARYGIHHQFIDINNPL